MSIKMNSDYTLRSYGCFVELFLIFYPLLLGFLQIIHLIYRYQLYLYTYHSTPYLNHIMVSVKPSIYIQKSAFFTDFLRSKSSADCLSFIRLKTNNIQKAEG